MWMRPTAAPAMAGGSTEVDAPATGRPRYGGIEVAFVAVLFGAATLFFGIIPSPLLDLADHAGRALLGLL
jgi:NADH-quinone oxidoreductase subunit N